jgi:hydrogenase expression/formation protein HypC
MKVIELKGYGKDGVTPTVALVEIEGIRKEARLDLVDRQPKIGDYLIVHAGFAMTRVDAETAEEGLKLLYELAEKSDIGTGGDKQ